MSMQNNAAQYATDSFWDFKKQDNVYIGTPSAMDEATARRLIPQTPRAERLFIQNYRIKKRTPYEAMQIVNRMIFGA